MQTQQSHEHLLIINLSMCLYLFSSVMFSFFSSENRNGLRKYARAVSNELTWYCQYLMVKCWKRRSHHQIFNFMKFEYLFSIVFFFIFILFLKKTLDDQLKSTLYSNLWNGSNYLFILLNFLMTSSLNCMTPTST